MPHSHTPANDGPAAAPAPDATFFRDAAEWRAWLEQHHDTAPGIWMGLRKAHVPDRGLVWADAVPEALCFGWIDSRVQRIDDDAVRQWWSPRRPGSTWSAVNVRLADDLVEQGRMRPAGLAAFASRRPDREAVYSYEQDVDGDWTPGHEAALAANPAASAFWNASIPSYQRLCRHWVVTAKQASTRERRLAQLVQCCADGELIPSQRHGQPPAWLARARAARDGSAAS